VTTPIAAAKSFIVVPDGLAADAQGRPLQKPSFVFRPVLDAVAGMAGSNDIVYIAPGNHFGSGRYEQTVAADYLLDLGVRATIYAPVVSDRGYIDTLGNAESLKPHLVDASHAHTCELVCSAVHARRAEMCFRRAGFVPIRVHRIPVPRESEPVVRRLWFFRYPPAYALYEFLARMREHLRSRFFPMHSE
jgi:uncharacterized SAM-binding protein YcdF (DUF218 family)